MAEESCTPDLFTEQFTPRLDEQFNILSCLSNNHWAPYLRTDGRFSKNGFCSSQQHLSFQPPSKTIDDDSSDNEHSPDYYPTSLRNRVIYFTNKSKRDYIYKVVRKCLMSEVEDETIFVESTPHLPPPKRRKRLPRVLKVPTGVLPAQPLRSLTGNSIWAIQDNYLSFPL